MKKIYLLISILIQLAANSQTIVNEIEGLGWRIIPSIPNNNSWINIYGSIEPFKQSMGDLEASKVYVSKDEAVMIVAFQKDDYGVIKVNSRMQVKWSTKLQGVPLKIAKLKDKIIVITDSDFKPTTGYSNSYFGAIIDPGNGKIITRKKIHQVEGDRVSEPKFFTSEDGSFFRMAIRKTEKEKKINVYVMGLGVGKASDEIAATREFMVFDISETLETSAPVKIPRPTGEFVDCTGDKDGNIYICTYNDDGIVTITSYQRDLTKKEAMNCIIDPKKNQPVLPRMFSSGKAGMVYLSVSYTSKDKDGMLDLFLLDFTNKTKKSHSSILNKAFKKEVKEDFVELNSKLDKLSTEVWDDLQTMEIIETGDKIIVWNECQGILHKGAGNTTKSYFYTSDAIIMVFNGEMKKLTTSVVPKHFEIQAVPLAMHSSVHLKDDKLYYVSTLIKPSVVFWGITGVFDISSMKMKRMDLIDKNEIKKSHPPDSKATLWFNDGYAIPYLDADGFITIKKFETSLQMISY